MQNPFQYGKVVGYPYFADRETELRDLCGDVQGRNNVVLYSPRRFGKTSLLFKLSGVMMEQGYKVLYLDFFRVTSRQAFMDLYSREVLIQSGKRWKSTLKKVGTLVKGIRPLITLDPVGNPGFSFTFEPMPPSQQTLEGVLNLTEKLDPEQKWLVIFDEFQEIGKLNGDGFENVLRSVIQHHTQTSYIFSGSRYHMLLDIFSQPGRPFYQFCKVMQLDKIAAESMAEYISGRFRETGLEISRELADGIIARSDNIPNYVQYIASEVWQLSVQSGKKPDDAMLQKAMENMMANLNDFFLQIWDGLSLQQKKLLIAISIENSNIFSRDYHARHRLGAVSSTQRAAQNLILLQLLSKHDSCYEFCDPLFKRFVGTRISF